ncbi:MAG: hypothetical protein C5B50_26135 [Verrucomicrobia bacterium]|nr:MAG: hypothetical protein C5B50_26135 [Verrucomicrobiota bacterium]
MSIGPRFNLLLIRIQNMKTKLIVLLSVVLALAGVSVQASVLFWSGNGSTLGGAGTWDTTNARWGTSTAGPFTTVWNNSGSDTATLYYNVAGGSVVIGAPVTINGTFEFDQTAGAFASYTVNGSQTMTFAAGSTLSCANIAAGSGLIVGSFNSPYAGTITKVGTGQITMNNANGSVTKWIMNAGAVRIAAPNRLGIGADAADFLTFNGGTLVPNTTTAWTMGKSITVNSAGGSIISSSSTITVTQDKPITWNNGNLTLQTGPYVLTSTTSSGSGTLTLNNGNTVTCGAAGVIPNTVLVSSILSGSQLVLNGFDQTVRSISGTAGTMACGGNTLTVNAPNGETYSSVISSTASGKFVKNGTGTLTLSGSSTGFAGELVLNNGTIGVGGANSLGASSSGSIVTLSGGKLSNTSASGRTIPSTASVNLSGDFTVDDSLFTGPGQILFNGAATIKNSNRTITVNGGANLGLGGVVGQDVAGRSLIKAGTGILALTAVNTYSGDTTISGGTININSTGTLGDGTGTLHLSGGTLNITASRTPSTAPVANAIDVTADSSITTSSTAATVDLNLSSGTVGTSGGSLTLSNAATAAAGVFQPRFSAGFSTTLPIKIANGVNGTTLLQSFNTTGNDQTFNGAISGSGSYKKTASTSGTGGKTTFTAANTYSGGTTVNDGTLLVSNSSGSGTGSGTVTVSANGTLGGNGEIAGATTVSGTLSPGASIGTLTFDSSLTLSGTTVMEVNKTLATADKIVMNGGTVTLGGALNIVNLAGTLMSGDTFHLIDGTMAGTFASVNSPGAGLVWNISQLAAGGSGNATVACDGTLAAHAGANQTVCNAGSTVIGGSPTATGGSGSYTYSWMPTTALNDPTLANPSASPTSTTTYTVTVTDSGGCTATSSVTVVAGATAISAQPTNQTVCSGATASFYVSASGPNLGYSWLKNNNGGWGNSWSASGSGSTFRASSTDNDFGDPACTGFSSAFDINSPSGNALGVWGGFSGDETVVRSLTALTAGQVVSIDFDNGNVDNGSKVGFSLQTSGGAADVLQFYFLGGQSNYKYNDGTEQDTGVPFQRTGLRIQFALTSATTYTLSVTPCGGSTIKFNGTYSGTIAQLKLFNQNNTGGNDKNIYFNNFIVGGYTDNADNYSGDFAGQDKGNQPIASGNGGSSYTTPTLSTSDNGTKYQVVVYGCGGTLLSSAATLTVNPLPTVSVNSPSICVGNSTTLTATTSASSPSYLWSPGGATSASIVVSPSSTASYTVTVTDGVTACVNSGSGTVTVNPLPTVSVNSATNCAGTPSVLTATTSASSPGYLWSPGGATSASIAVSPSSTTTYTVLVTDGATGCTNSASGTATVIPLPTVSVNSATNCAGSPSLLTATTSASNPSYLWSPGGATTSSITVAPSSTTTYTVLVTDGVTGCTNSASGTVTAIPLPSVSVNSATNCAGGSSVLTATTGASSPSYLWSPGADTNASITVSPSSTTTYTVTVTDGVTGCANSASGTVTVNPLPTVSVNSATNCAGGSSVLAATTSASSPSYSWSPGGATTASITVSPASTTTYTVTVTDGVTGCTNSASGTVTVNPLPTVSVNSPSVCAGGSATLTATTSASNPSYLWSPGGDTNASITVSPSSNTTYTVTVTDGVTGCAKNGSGTVTVVPQPVLLTDTTNQTACAGTQITWRVAASGTGLSYQWQRDGTNLLDGVGGFTGTTTASLTNSSVGAQDSVDVAHGYDCVISSSPCTNVTSTVVSLTVNPLPSVSVNSSNICAGGSATLTATASASSPSYLWSPGGATTASITVSPSSTTTYTVTVTDGVTGCANSASGTVTVHPTPSASAGPNESACSGSGVAIGGSPTASGGTAPYTYGWTPTTGLSDPTVANPTATITSTTTYSVLVTDANGCTASSSMVLTVIPSPIISPTPTLSGTDVILTWSSLAGTTYRVQYTSSFNPASWNDLTPDVTASGSTATYTDHAGAATQRFYRVRVICP